VLKARTFNDLGIAGIVAAVLISRGAGYAIGTGIVLCILVFGRDFFRNWNTYDKTKDPVFNSQFITEVAPSNQPAALPEPELSIR